jgi:hypothetical protein
MHLGTIIDGGTDIPVVVDPVRGVAPAADLILDVAGDLLSLITGGRVDELVAAAQWHRTAPSAPATGSPSPRHTGIRG